MDTAVTFNLWPQILAAHGKIGQSLPPSVRQDMHKLVAAYDVEPWYIFHFIYVVENYDATVLSTAHFQKRDPFDHPKLVDEFWAGCLAAGFLKQNNDGTMQITEKGEAVRQQRWQILHEGLAELTLLPDDDLAQLNALLARVVAETAATTTKSTAWAFHTRRQKGLKPPIEPLTPLAHLIELRMDLGAYQDDAHLTTWQRPYDVSPHAWEILSTIWQNRTATLDGLVKDLARRGFAQSETAVALQELVQLGWLQQERENYCLTDSGQAIRQEAEQHTNGIFYAPWSVLNTTQLETLAESLLALG